ncbi:MAG: hypothetical protein K6F92_00850 [Lachnospiraceae bacterium]|nr:hypothetical protein [Lachnospiraceae bacterium]
MDQIEFCNLMILNKTDLLSDEQLLEVKEGLRNLQQEAQMIECVNGNQVVFIGKGFEKSAILELLYSCIEE